MTDFRHPGDASDATTNDTRAAVSGVATVSDGSTAMRSAVTVEELRHDGDASDAKSAADLSLADQLEYTLTVKQAAELFTRHGRKVPSERSLQRYCSDDPPLIRGLKIKTTYGQEWLINEASLLTYIETLPLEPDASSALPPATPDNVATTPDGDASVATPPNEPAKSRDDRDDTVATGETRKLTDVLIENARLLERVEGRDELVKFLRSELDKRDRNTLEILETFKAIGTRQLAPSASKTSPSPPPSSSPRIEARRHYPGRGE
jgi:hypothetical protein